MGPRNFPKAHQVILLCNQFANPFIIRVERSKPRGDATYFVKVPEISLSQLSSSELPDFSVFRISMEVFSRKTV